jgi:hypothetical protein
MSNLLEHAKRELSLAGFDVDDNSYMNLCAKNALDLIEVLEKGKHSGMSVEITLDLFEKLARWKTLSPLTNDPEEWSDIGDVIEHTYQSKRNPTCFTTDFKKYHDLNENRVDIASGVYKFRDEKDFIYHDLKDVRGNK